jgi:hypothetical protein
MDEDEFHEESEVAKSINAWRQSERKVMIDTIQDLIRTSHKYSKSQYTPQVQRARWTKLAGQLIWYEDQILKSLTLEAMTIEMQELKKRVMESEERRELQSRSGNFPLIGFRKPGDRKEEEVEKAKNEEASEPVQADEPEAAKEIA